MQHAHHERSFQQSGKPFTAVLNEQADGRLSVAVRLPDGSLRVVPGEHFKDEGEAMAAASSFARELVGSC